MRTWTDRSKSFSVEAQFLGLKDSKIHLHKMNGVKIAVPIAKMSVEDLEYIENLTGISLDDEKPLANVKKNKSAERKEPEAGASIGKPSRPEYDWFQFFLSCDVAVGLCERYAQAFSKDSMDESVLPDVDTSILRNLGLREGDIIKVMRTLDSKYGRTRTGDKADGEGGLFSGPGGALRNNTRKGRPAPAVQTSDVVDASAFSKKEPASSSDDATRSPEPASPINGREPARAAPTESSGFDDDAWDVKPSKQRQQPPARSEKPQYPAESTSLASPPPSALTGSMKELSLLTAPLEPTRTGPPAQLLNNTGELRQPPLPGPASLPAQPTGATPSFFSSLPQPQQPVVTGQSGQHIQTTSLGGLASQPLRQRPTPPQLSSGQGALVPPPPQRPLSAPQSAQQSAFAPPALAPQMTGSLQSQVAPPGQSLHEINQSRLQQQYLAQMQQQQHIQPNMTGYPGATSQVMTPFSSGIPGHLMQPMMTGAPGQSPFADPGRPGHFSPIQVQPSGFQPGYPTGPVPYGQNTGNINSFLPPALEPNRTGMPPLQTQVTGLGGFGRSMAPQEMQPLQPQKTGPPPPVRFGVTGEPKKLISQPTGRRANLAQASE